MVGRLLTGGFFRLRRTVAHLRACFLASAGPESHGSGKGRIAHTLVAKHVTGMIVCTRADRTRSYVSPGSRALLGYEPEEIVERDFATFLHPDDRETVEKLKAGHGRGYDACRQIEMR